jgi:hypothetical protein
MIVSTPIFEVVTIFSTMKGDLKMTLQDADVQSGG